MVLFIRNCSVPVSQSATQVENLLPVDQRSSPHVIYVIVVVITIIGIQGEENP